ncbi:hypothetical protein [Virgibacillus doumboii]|uniref:hypothetical protein n=1 Tax=Virgibacillus doumboii TaxID=2697503 RepID=UPI0013E0A183|nr:hypothetical protein [Virgibacillus doumboii]
MSVNQVLGQRLTSSKIADAPMVLRPGQIVQGKIDKLFPNNKAQIQMGSQKMIAQLEASLTLRGRYHFQVQASDSVIYLKVIGNQLKKQTDTNIANLFQQLGLKLSKSNAAFMKTLINEKIPFSKEQLAKAFQLLDRSGNKTQSQQVLKEMIAARLPITDSVFQALTTKNTSGLTDQMKALLNQLRHVPDITQLQQDLINRLSQLVERPLNAGNALVNHIQTEVSNNSQSFFNMLKVAGTVDPTVDFTAWKSEWTSFAQKNNGSTAQLPFQLNSTNIINTLEQMNTNQTAVRSEAAKILQSWSSLLGQSATNRTALTSQQFTQLKQQLTSSLLPLLSNEQQQQITKLLQNNPVQLRQLLTTLTTMADRQTYMQAEQVLSNLKLGESFFYQTPKDQFLSHLQNVLRFTGLNHENLLAEDMMQQQSNTIKSMLLQMIQKSDGTLHDRSQQLLNLINGLQIQSVNESSNVIQANLQLPAEKLGLTDDMQLEFEGKRTEDGEINPDFCRIVFYLNLSNLKETVIDMNIQKRAVAITIFNDQKHVSEQSAFLKPMLKEGLEKLDYKLSTVTVKPIHHDKPSSLETAKAAYQNAYQGVDYRI